MIDRLKKLVRPELAEQYGPAIFALEMSDIERLHFLTQILFESGMLRRKVENMSYSAFRLLKIFPKHFKTLEKAKRYEYNPEAIGNLVYANRGGNGPESSGDGFRYRGRGFIQVTFRDNYRAFSEWIGDPAIMTTPRLVATKYPVESAAWYWHRRDLGRFAVERGDNIEDYKADLSDITYRVNGSRRSAEERFLLFKKVRAAITA